MNERLRSCFTLYTFGSHSLQTMTGEGASDQAALNPFLLLSTQFGLPISGANPWFLVPNSLNPGISDLIITFALF